MNTTDAKLAVSAIRHALNEIDELVWDPDTMDWAEIKGAFKKIRQEAERMVDDIDR